jgi:hypothetical protein
MVKAKNSPTPEELHDLLEEAWGIIANAGGWDDPKVATKGWRNAAIVWREEYFATLDRAERHGHISAYPKLDENDEWEKDCCKEAANHIIDCNLKMKPEDN